jgi:hypothetical protein
MNSTDSPGVYCHTYIEFRPTKYGTGIFATNHIPADTIIIREQPFTLSKEILCNDFTKYACQSIKQLLTYKKNEFLSLVPFNLDEYALEELKNSSIEDWHQLLLPKLTTEEMYLYYMKYSRNAFLIDEQKDGYRLAIFFFGTKLNHSCNPSVEEKFNGNEMVFRTTRSIEPNSELFGDYLLYQPMLKSKAERQKYLLTNYGFLCRCEKCENDL